MILVKLTVPHAECNYQFLSTAHQLHDALGSITGALARLIGNLIAQGASEAYQYFEDKIKEAGGNVVDGILLGILDALLGIGSWIVDNVFKPILDGFKNAFGIHSPSTVMQEQAYLRKALKILNDMLLLKNMPADFPAEKI